MKKFKLILIVVCLMILASCANSSGSDDNKTNENTKMVTYTSKSGDVLIPENPQKIVADYYVGELLKLNANVVGANLTYKSSAWSDKIADIKDIGDSIESVYALEPDLIITMNEGLVEQYSEIAPTICIPYGTYNPEELILELSKITNTKDIANEWIEDFNNSILELKDLVKIDETYSIVDTVGQDWYLYGENYGRGGYILYNKLGLNGTEKGETDYIHNKESYLLLSIEAMPEYIDDNLFIMNEDGTDSGSIDTFKRYSENDVFKSLGAYKNNNISYFKSEDFWYTDPYSLDLQVSILKEYFNEKK